MAAEDSIKRLEERLTRLEAALAQQAAGTGGFTPPGGTIVDPPPWVGGWGFYARPVPRPVVDPAPWGSGGWGHPRWPTPVVDPAPWPTPVVDPAPWPTPVVDPAPWGGVAVRPTVSTMFGRIGQIGDPPPIDVSRLSISQLESSLHTINAEKARLNSMETLIKQQLEKLRQSG